MDIGDIGADVDDDGPGPRDVGKVFAEDDEHILAVEQEDADQLGQAWRRVRPQASSSSGASSSSSTSAPVSTSSWPSSSSAPASSSGGPGGPGTSSSSSAAAGHSATSAASSSTLSYGINVAMHHDPSQIKRRTDFDFIQKVLGKRVYNDIVDNGHSEIQKSES